MSIKVSIVIVSWNVRDLLLDCVKPFYGDERIQLIVVDNNSQDDTVNTLKAKYPEITIIENKNNPGFSKANNQGFELCQGEFVYILNPDTLSTVEDLMKLIKVMELDLSVGGVSPKIFYGNGQIQSSCARLLPTLSSYLIIDVLKLSKIPLIGKRLKRNFKYPYNYECSTDIQACSGAAYLVRRELLSTIGGFNPIYLHTGEDIDLMSRVLKAGFKNYYCADSILIHYAGQSSKQSIYRVQINTNISTWHFYRISKGRLYGFLFRIILIFIDLPLRMINNVLKILLLRRNALKDFAYTFKVYLGILKWKEVK